MIDDNNYKKRCAIYCRVSTQEQAEMGYSLDEQERLLREYCNRNNYEVYDCYSDRGISGKNITNRPAIQKLIKEAQENKFDIVLCWKINRLARNLLDILEMANLLDKYGVGIKSYSEPFETETASGKLQFNMMAAVGEFERQTIAQNVKMGMLARARDGKWNGGTVLGYDVVKNEECSKEKGQATKLAINPTEAETVKLIYKMYSEGNGYKTIVNTINNEGYKTKKGNMFSVGTLKEILKNPVYIGKIRYNLRQEWNEKRRRNINKNPILVDGEHEPIIDLDTWEKVQYNLSQSKGKPSRIYDGEYPLTGILRCPVCGAGMVISRTTNTNKDGSKRRIAYYVCGAWKNKGTAACRSNGVKVEEVNAVVYEKLTKFTSDEKLIKDVIDAINKEIKEKVEPSQNQIEKLIKNKEDIEKKKEKTVELYEDGLINKEEFSARIKTLRGRQEELEVLIYDCEKNISNANKEEFDYTVVKDILGDFFKLMRLCDSQEQRKKLLHMMVSEVTINEMRDIESIKLNINSRLIAYIKSFEGVSTSDTPSFMMHKIMYGKVDYQLVI